MLSVVDEPGQRVDACPQLGPLGPMPLLALRVSAETDGVTDPGRCPIELGGTHSVSVRSRRAGDGTDGL